MKRSIILCRLLLVLVLFSRAQTAINIIVTANVILPKDSSLTKNLLKSLDNFLVAAQGANDHNPFILDEDLLVTSVLLDEMKEVEKSEKLGNDHFYKCCLLSILKRDSANYLIRFSYAGVNESIPVIRAVFSVLVRKRGNQFYFCSPINQNTKHWKRKRIGKTVFYHQGSFQLSRARKYFKMIEKYDKKLMVKYGSKTFYACADFNEALRITGVDYKSDYSARSRGALSARENNRLISVDGLFIPGSGDFDPHDLWHSRLSKVLPASVTNRPVDEGAAYLYGGSWGLSWKTILEKFRAYAKSNESADWLALYNESRNFDEKSKYPLNVDFVINALFIREIEKQKGFTAVLELLACGKKEKTNENYFSALEKIAGINKDNFNAAVRGLINK